MSKKQSELTSKVKRLSQKFAYIDYEKATHTNFITKVKFSFCRLMQKSLHKADDEYLDGKYWAEQGWLGSIRTWKQETLINVKNMKISLLDSKL